MENSVIINGEQRVLSDDELKKLGYKKCDLCGNIFYAPNLEPRRILVKKRRSFYIPRERNYYLTNKEFIICDDCLERVTNVIVDSNGKHPKFIR